MILFTRSTGRGGVLVAFKWTWWDGVGVAVFSPWNKGERGGCPGVFAVVARVVQGTRGPWHYVQEREGSERGPTVVAGVLGTVAYSAPLSPPATAPARCSTYWPQELKLSQKF